MTDRELLLLSYGAMKACSHNESRLKSTVHLLEEHLFPLRKADAGSHLDPVAIPKYKKAPFREADEDDDIGDDV